MEAYSFNSRRKCKWYFTDLIFEKSESALKRITTLACFHETKSHVVALDLFEDTVDIMMQSFNTLKAKNEAKY